VSGGLVRSSPRLAAPADILILMAVLAAAGWSWFSSPGSDGSKAAVYVDGKRMAWWNLEGPRSVDTVEGALGPVVVEHGQGSARILWAPCPHHLCMRAGSIHRTGAELACVPSHLVVVVEGTAGKENDLDAIP
jgi:hypothetical protein